MLAAVVAFAGYASVTRSLAYPLRTGDIERAYSLSPGDGRIVALLAQKLAGADATPADRVRAGRLARVALRKDPTAVAAVATLGLNAQIRGDVVGARRLFAYAERLSRRDITTEIWSIEDAVGRGDVAGALRHYDIALRTSDNAPELLFPVLAMAIADPAIRTALTGTLARKPPWGSAFLDYAAVHGPDPRATARLFIGLRRLAIPVSGNASAEIVNLLVAKNLLDDAWAYYASVRPGADRRRSRDPRFATDIDNPSYLDWIPVNDGGISTSIQRGGSGNVFDFAAPASIGGVLLKQVQLLPPGAYRLEGHATGIEQPEGSRPYWTLSCADGRELGRVAMPGSAQANGASAGRFNVPEGCPVQTLALVARPSDMISGVSGQIDRVQLLPER